MKVTCPKCSAEYSVQPDRIPPSGIDMKCSKCLHTFRLSPEQIRSGRQSSPEGLNIQGVTFLGDQGGQGGFGGGASERYFIRRPSGKVFGPFEKQLIREMLRANKLRGDESLSHDKELWTPLASLPDFADQLQSGAGASSNSNLKRTMRGFGGVGGPSMTGLEEGGAGFGLGGPSGGRPALGGPSADSNASLMGRSGFNLDQGPSGGDFDLFGTSDAELPMPAGLDAELPAPRGHDAELPASRGYDAELPAPRGFDAELPAPRGHDAELPAPRGFDAELPAPRGHGAELPAPRGFDAELPAPRGYDAELPAPRGYGAELPVP
ncbi:MAG: zinc-ribbon domain-containing protein, partial [Myxococcota bacterium]